MTAPPPRILDRCGDCGTPQRAPNARWLSPLFSRAAFSVRRLLLALIAQILINIPDHQTNLLICLVIM